MRTRGAKLLPQLGVLPHAVAVAANRDQVGVVDKLIDKSGGHDVVTEDVAPPAKRSSKRLFEVSTGEPARSAVISRSASVP